MACEGADFSPQHPIVMEAGLCRKCGQCNSTIAQSPDGTYCVTCPECHDTFRLNVSLKPGEPKVVITVTE